MACNYHCAVLISGWFLYLTRVIDKITVDVLFAFNSISYNGFLLGFISNFVMSNYYPVARFNYYKIPPSWDGEG